MNTKIISALVIIAAMATVIPAFMVPANAQFSAFNTNNSIGDKTVTQTQVGVGGAGGAGGLAFGGSANGGNGGDVTQSQGFCEQNAQSGAFGSSINTDTGSVSNSSKSIGKDCS
jgi:hypothetical protein